MTAEPARDSGNLGEGIDRQALVERHTVVLREADVRSPLSVGNGEFCFTADITGLQTFPDHYPVESRDGTGPGTLLGTQAQWGWHSTPGGASYRVDDMCVGYQTPGRAEPVPYVDMSGTIGGTGDRSDSAAELWLRANPHRLDLGRIGFRLLDSDGRVRRLTLADVEDAVQRLDLWRGILHSSFTIAGYAVNVETVCHPERDVLAVRIRSDALRESRAAVGIAFSYGAERWHDAADWSRPDAHRTTVRRRDGGWQVDRELDATGYQVEIAASPGVALDQVGPHELRVTSSSAAMELVVGFTDGGGPDRAASASAPLVLPSSFDDVRSAAAEHWRRFWTEGAAVDLDGSTDDRAPELERRVVLSQYLTAINGAGSVPPQETGLVCNSWFGKFHLEMVWWHVAHFGLWNRPGSLERVLRWYRRASESGRETAKRQGYAGVRWPKMVGPDGRESPSPIGPFLIWQQPHPIYLAELLYRNQSMIMNSNRAHSTESVHDHGSGRVLEEYAGIVFETAEFMASFARPTSRGYELGPPVIPAQESYGSMRARASNPTFELAYWQWALGVAQQWRRRLGLAPDPHWDAVAHGLVRPHVRDGVYAAIDVEPYTIRTDHPSMLCGLGFLPRTPLIEPETMRATLRDVLDDWDWDSTWGWDYPVLAMCAARLEEPELAVSALTMEVGKNTYLASGHNRQTDSLPLYLPGNGGVLAAVALMAAGWDGMPDRHAPGFPHDGRWTVRHEGLIRSP
ncbi:hypothetical protein [Phytoactinopolyspora halotolerans]|uniref:Glycoside hydrolase family 65 n=1 Tax=Phytoactinopolyspora halotolerans TaxID=1981512 RepID=A0A6L9SC13_9ACTN|nr:hypothetical protein [Phytoactinopolyspora halotolerans]NEE02905.1 hypothetical protein [Phytoactinopolyspora halotolerans]